MTAKVEYNGELRTTCTHLKSGSTFETDAPTDNFGKGERFSPTDLVATALASCILTTLGLHKLTKHIDIVGATCMVEKVMVAQPRRRIGEVNITMSFPKGSIYSAEDRAAIIEVANTCPVIESLHPDCKKGLVIDWNE